MPLLGGALGVALLSFSNAIVVARSFAAKGRYEVDVDQEFIALGACQIAAGLSQGFAISGADSRTAMNYASRGQKPDVHVGVWDVPDAPETPNPDGRFGLVYCPKVP
jgi:MFS superfamily sulfate permease-like transporter